MARVKSPAAKKHRKILAKAKGFKQSRRKRIHGAMEAVMHAGAYAYHGRKRRKRDMRALWITRLSASAKLVGTSYSKLISGLKKEKIKIDLFGRNGKFTTLVKNIKNVPAEERKSVGSTINEVKNTIEGLIAEQKN